MLWQSSQKNYPECCALDIEQIVTVHSIARLAVFHISQVDEPFFLEILKSFLHWNIVSACSNEENLLLIFHRTIQRNTVLELEQISDARKIVGKYEFNVYK